MHGYNDVVRAVFVACVVLLKTVLGKHFTDLWAVHIKGGEAVAKNVSSIAPVSNRTRDLLVQHHQLQSFSETKALLKQSVQMNWWQVNGNYKPEHDRINNLGRNAQTRMLRLRIEQI